MRKKETSQNRIKYLVAAALFAALTAVGAQLRVQLPSGVPMTMQTLVVLLSGFLLGSYYGPWSQVLYVFTGLIGFPVFAEGGGPAYILKPTFGYLVGYPLASYTVAMLIYHKKSTLDLFDTRYYLGEVSKYRWVLAGVAGYLAIFIPGVSYLYFATNFILNVPVAFETILTAGFLFFIPGDIIKLAAIMIFLSFWAVKEKAL
ncbi:MAG: biotin transporter BioY [bacterium]